MFENLCHKFDENLDVKNGSLFPNQSPFSIAAKFLQKEDLKDLIQVRNFMLENLALLSSENQIHYLFHCRSD